MSIGNLIAAPKPKYDVLVYKCHPDAKLPERKTAEAAGYDLCVIEDFELPVGGRVVVGTGLVVQPPPGYHTEILIRSGIAYRYGIFLTNSVGLIDRDYSSEKDELKLMLTRPSNLAYNKTKQGIDPMSDDFAPAIFKKGDRIAQLVFRQTELFNIVQTDKAPKEDVRGGLGSTGIK